MDAPGFSRLDTTPACPAFAIYTATPSDWLMPRLSVCDDGIVNCMAGLSGEYANLRRFGRRRVTSYAAFSPPNLSYTLK